MEPPVENTDRTHGPVSPLSSRKNDYGRIYRSTRRTTLLVPLLRRDIAAVIFFRYNFRSREIIGRGRCIMCRDDNREFLFPNRSELKFEIARNESERKKDSYRLKEVQKSLWFLAAKCLNVGIFPAEIVRSALRALATSRVWANIGNESLIGTKVTVRAQWNPPSRGVVTPFPSPPNVYRISMQSKNLRTGKLSYRENNRALKDQPRARGTFQFLIFSCSEIQR